MRLVSEDLDELLELSDCIAAVASGKIAYEAWSSEADRSTLGRQMTSHVDSPSPLPGLVTTNVG